MMKGFLELQSILYVNLKRGNCGPKRKVNASFLPCNMKTFAKVLDIQVSNKIHLLVLLEKMTAKI